MKTAIHTLYALAFLASPAMAQETSPIPEPRVCPADMDPASIHMIWETGTGAYSVLHGLEDGTFCTMRPRTEPLEMEALRATVADLSARVDAAEAARAEAQAIIDAVRAALEGE